MKREDEKKDLDEIMLESLLQGKFPLTWSFTSILWKKKYSGWFPKTRTKKTGMVLFL